jgi:hypothetical protein
MWNNGTHKKQHKNRNGASEKRRPYFSFLDMTLWYRVLLVEVKCA